MKKLASIVPLLAGTFAGQAYGQQSSDPGLMLGLAVADYYDVSCELPTGGPLATPIHKILSHITSTIAADLDPTGEAERPFLKTVAAEQMQWGMTTGAR